MDGDIILRAGYGVTHLHIIMDGDTQFIAHTTDGEMDIIRVGDTTITITTDGAAITMDIITAITMDIITGIMPV